MLRQQRAEGHEELRALVHTVVVEQMAELLGIDPDDTPTKASFVALFHTLARATLTPVYSC